MPEDIVVRDVTFAYAPGSSPILRHFSAHIPLAGVTAFMGPSGCGKSTFLRLLLGLESPDAGTITGLDGLRPAVVFQEDRLLPWYTALENILVVLPSAAEQREKEACARGLLQALGIAEAAGQNVSALSGGQRRRVALARALAVEPTLLVLDEPFKGLDAAAKGQAIDLIKQYGDMAVVLATHDVDDVAAFHAKLYKMDNWN